MGCDLSSIFPLDIFIIPYFGIKVNRQVAQSLSEIFVQSAQYAQIGSWRPTTSRRHFAVAGKEKGRALGEKLAEKVGKVYSAENRSQTIVLVRQRLLEVFNHILRIILIFIIL